MNLELFYTELSFLRELLQKEKMRIWREDFLPRLKDKSDKNIKEVFDKMMESEVPLGSRVLTDTDCCKSLLQKIRNIEIQIKEDIEGVS